MKEVVLEWRSVLINTLNQEYRTSEQRNRSLVILTKTKFLAENLQYILDD